MILTLLSPEKSPQIYLHFPTQPMCVFFKKKIKYSLSSLILLNVFIVFQWRVVCLQTKGCTFMRTNFSSPSSHQLPVTPQLMVGFHIHLPYSAGILSGLSLHGYYAHCLNYCEFIDATALLRPESNVSLQSSTIYGC